MIRIVSRRNSTVYECESYERKTIKGMKCFVMKNVIFSMDRVNGRTSSHYETATVSRAGRHVESES